MRVGRTGKEALGFVGVVYVIFKFGVSMSTLFEQVSDSIRKETKYVTGCDVSRVHFFVTGVKSKNLVRRDLEFIY